MYATVELVAASGRVHTVRLGLPDPKSLYRVLERMTRQETQFLRQHPHIPHPYDAGIIYKTEGYYPTGRPIEKWQRIKTTLRKRWGDCEDLAIYLAAWIRARMGIMAKVALLRYQQGHKVWYHAVVLMPDGRMFDPSKVLGM